MGADRANAETTMLFGMRKEKRWGRAILPVCDVSLFEDATKLQMVVHNNIQSPDIYENARFKDMVILFTNDPYTNLVQGGGFVVSLGYYCLSMRVENVKVLSTNPLVVEGSPECLTRHKMLRPLRRVPFNLLEQEYDKWLEKRFEVRPGRDPDFKKSKQYRRMRQYIIPNNHSFGFYCVVTVIDSEADYNGKKKLVAKTVVEYTNPMSQYLLPEYTFEKNYATEDECMEQHTKIYQETAQMVHWGQ